MPNAISHAGRAAAGRLTAGESTSIDINNDLFCWVGWTSGCSISDRHDRIKPIPVKLTASGRPHLSSLRAAAYRAVEAYNAAIYRHA